MKIDFHLFDRWKSHDEQGKLIHWAALTLSAAATIATLVSLYVWIYRSIIMPPIIDASRIIASQKKVNKATLNTILQFDDQRRAPTDISHLRNPFSTIP